MTPRRAAVRDTVVCGRELAAAMVHSVGYSMINTTDCTEFCLFSVPHPHCRILIDFSYPDSLFPISHSNVHYYLFRLCEYSTRPDRSHQICHAMSST